MKVTHQTTTLGGVTCFVARPESATPGARLGAVVAYSDIFQLTPPHLRMVVRLASQGFVVVAPELYGRFEPAATVLDFEADRQRALDDSAKVSVAELDRDLDAVLGAVAALPEVGKIGALGWCFGGHVAFRAAFDPRVAATACCYPTGVHDGKLGTSDGVKTQAGSLERAGEIHSELLLVWGRKDPHIPAEGRAKIHQALEAAKVKFEARLYDAEHTFMRDPDLRPSSSGDPSSTRYDGEAADRAFAAIVELFQRNLSSENPGTKR